MSTPLEKIKSRLRTGKPLSPREVELICDGLDSVVQSLQTPVPPAPVARNEVQKVLIVEPLATGVAFGVGLLISVAVPWILLGAIGGMLAISR